jgi:hypothetical protein
VHLNKRRRRDARRAGAGTRAEVCMEVLNVLTDILRSLGRIEGELVEIRKLSGRVSRLEMWQSWLKGGWAALTAAFALLYRQALWK